MDVKQGSTCDPTLSLAYPNPLLKKNLDLVSIKRCYTGIKSLQQSLIPISLLPDVFLIFQPMHTFNSISLNSSGAQEDQEGIFFELKKKPGTSRQVLSFF